MTKLVPFSDYFLGTRDTFFSDTEDLFKVIERSEEKDICIYMYNADTDENREVLLHPCRSWSSQKNSGLLGCEIGEFSDQTHVISLCMTVMSHSFRFACPKGAVMSTLYPLNQDSRMESPSVLNKRSHLVLKLHMAMEYSSRKEATEL